MKISFKKIYFLECISFTLVEFESLGLHIVQLWYYQS